MSPEHAAAIRHLEGLMLQYDSKFYERIRLARAMASEELAPLYVKIVHAQLALHRIMDEESADAK